MNTLVDIYRPLKSSVPRPTRQALEDTVEKMWMHAENQAHELRKGPELDQFYAAALDSAFSSLKAIKFLSAPYRTQCGAILRLLVEVCVDFFWVASLEKNKSPIGRTLASHFFRFSDWKFDQLAHDYPERFKDDVFLRDLTSPYSDPTLHDKAIAQASGVTFQGNWREETSLLPKLGDVTWTGRATIASAFVEKHQNLKGAPYLNNLRILSSFAHFDPAHIAEFSTDYFDAIFDRNLNIALGFAMDMLLYSYKHKGWEPPQSLTMLNHGFVYFST